MTDRIENFDELEHHLNEVVKNPRVHEWNVESLSTIKCILLDQLYDRPLLTSKSQKQKALYLLLEYVQRKLLKEQTEENNQVAGAITRAQYFLRGEFKDK